VKLLHRAPRGTIILTIIEQLPDGSIIVHTKRVMPRDTGICIIPEWQEAYYISPWMIGRAGYLFIKGRPFPIDPSTGLNMDVTARILMDALDTHTMEKLLESASDPRPLLRISFPIVSISRLPRFIIPLSIRRFFSVLYRGFFR